MSWQSVRIPRRMNALQRDARGYPVPFIVLRDSDGRPHFTVNDSARRLRALLEKRCHICGGRLDKTLWLVGGPMSAFHERGCYNDGPLHQECMEYAMRVCPYLALTKYMGRIDAAAVDTSKLPGSMLFFDPTINPERPPMFVCVESPSYTLTDKSEVCYVHPLRPYLGVQYWRGGARLMDCEARTVLDDLGVLERCGA